MQPTEETTRAELGRTDVPPELLPELSTDELETAPGDLQQTLDATRVTNIPAELAADAATEAWTWLRADLETARWTDLTLRAHAVAAPGLEYTDRPALVHAELWYAGTNPAGQPVDLHTQTVTLGRSPDGVWVGHRLREVTQ